MDKQKKKYESPKIKAHGNIEKLTKGSTGPEIDGTMIGTNYPG